MVDRRSLDPIQQTSRRLAHALETLQRLIRRNVSTGDLPATTYPEHEVYTFVANDLTDTTQRETAKEAIRQECPPTYRDAAAIVARFKESR